MNAPATPVLYTPEDLLKMPDGDRFELVDGHLRERNMGGRSSFTGSRINYILWAFCEEHQLGSVFDAEGSFQCFPNRPRLVRKPDVSFIRQGRLSGEDIPDGYIRIAPDLAVEVVSPNDTYYEVDRKVSEYLSAGVCLVWVLNPDARTAHVYRPDGTANRLREDQQLDGEDVLPGFACRIGDLFPPPPAEPAAPSES